MAGMILLVTDHTTHEEREMNNYFLMLNGGQESSLQIQAWDMGGAIRTAKEKIENGWDVVSIRNGAQGEDHYRGGPTGWGRLI